MSKLTKGGADEAGLAFPNPSRSYDETRRGVCFWGYDQSMEVLFLVEAPALRKLEPGAQADEAGLLAAFDAHRERICALAAHAYSRRRRAAHIFSYTLTSADL